MAAKKKDKKWIQKTDMDKGAFTAKAQHRGLTAAQFQKKVLADPSKFDTRTVKQANLRKTLVGMNG
jgi:hypothetical protein